jgi:uridylate kinase
VSQQVIVGMLLGVDNMLLNMAMKEKDVNTIVLTTMECNHVTDPIKTKLMF